MIIDKIIKRKEHTINLIEKSNLSAIEKEDYCDLITSAAEGTNGLSESAKLQSVSESVFNLTNLVINEKLSKKYSTWKDVLINCKREILWLGITICVLLVFRPEIATIISNNIK